MAEGRLRTAVVGLDEVGQRLLQGIARLGDYFELAAVADVAGDLAQAAGKRYGASSFDDLRQMLTQNELDLVVSSGPLHWSMEHLQAAMKRGCHILRYPPAARSFGEAAELLKTARENNVFFAGARDWRYRKGAIAMKDFIERNPEEQFYLVEAWCSSGLQPEGQDWRKDPQLAGGGAILHLSWPLIDQIATLFSTPQQVYALCTNLAPDRKQRQSLTEDTAVVTMKFDDRLIGKLVATRTMLASGWVMRVHGKNCQLVLNEKGFTARDSQGQPLADVKRPDGDDVVTDKMLKDFVTALLSEDQKSLESEPAEILRNMAIIQAAYLSDKTGMPEEPARIYEMSAR